MLGMAGRITLVRNARAYIIPLRWVYAIMGHGPLWFAVVYRMIYAQRVRVHSMQCDHMIWVWLHWCDMIWSIAHFH